MTVLYLALDQHFESIETTANAAIPVDDGIHSTFRPSYEQD